MMGVLLWKIDLSGPPVVRQMAVATHGDPRREIYRDLQFWCMHAYGYHAKLRMGEHWMTLEPGMVSIAPPGVELEYRYRGRSTHVYAHFDLPRGKGPMLRVAALRSLQRGFESFERRMREAVGWMGGRPARARSRLWELLWELTGDDAPTMQTHGHPIVDRAVEQIALHLGEPLNIADLARRVDISHAHLVRLFRQHVGVAPLRYVRAQHLLERTTLPIKSIAHQIGVSDLQQFNKLIRRELHRSPRQLRG